MQLSIETGSTSPPNRMKQTNSFGELSTSPSDPPSTPRTSSKSSRVNFEGGNDLRRGPKPSSEGWGDFLSSLFGSTSSLVATYHSCCGPAPSEEPVTIDRRLAMSAMSSLDSASEEVVPRYVSEFSAFESPPGTPTGGGLNLRSATKTLSEAGDVYRGQFETTKDIPHGRGVFTAADGSTYRGQWEEGEKHGHGVYTHADGTIFDGQWQQGEKHGIGLETWTDGTKYEGEYCCGMKQGTGVYRNSRGMEYIGGFSGDQMHGHGGLKFEDGRKYAGQWMQGQMHGNGRMEWPSGDVFEGLYERGHRNGFGKLKHADGRVCSGLWQTGEPQGQLEWTDAEGQPIEEPQSPKDVSGRLSSKSAAHKEKLMESLRSEAPAPEQQESEQQEEDEEGDKEASSRSPDEKGEDEEGEQEVEPETPLSEDEEEEEQEEQLSLGKQAPQPPASI